MKFHILKSALTVAALFVTGAAYAEETAAVDLDTPPQSLTTAFENWSQQPFYFDAMVSNQRRSRPDFQFKIDGVRYAVLFDAGRQKRNAILDCLELSDECEVRGTAFMLFDAGKMQMNVTDIDWLAVPAIDFDYKAARLHRCVKSISRDRKPFSGIVEAKLSILDLEKRQGHQLDPIQPREIGRGFELLEDAVHDCSSYRFRLPVGEYRVKVLTQSGDVFLDYYDD